MICAPIPSVVRMTGGGAPAVIDVAPVNTISASDRARQWSTIVVAILNVDAPVVQQR